MGFKHGTHTLFETWHQCPDVGKPSERGAGSPRSPLHPFCFCNHASGLLAQAPGLPAQASNSSVLRKRQIAHMIFEYFRPTEAHEAVEIVSDLSIVRLQNDDVQDFDVRVDQALLSASETPREIVQVGLYKSKLKDSVQLQTLLALYHQETVRNTELFKIEDSCEVSYRSNDENSKLQCPK